MSKLNHLQTQFQNHLLNDILEKDPQIIGHMEIYYEGYRSRLLEVLTIDYPQCQTLIDNLFGADAFENAGLEYLKQYPSHHFSVRHFGQYFSQFLSKSMPYCDYSYLSELADFEWCILFSLDAANANRLEIDTLKTIPAERWADLRFNLHPSVQYRNYQWNTPALWKNIETTPEKGAPITCLIWRKNNASFFEILPPTHQSFYNSILCKKTFADLCEDLLAIMPENQYDMVPATAVGILQYWIEQDIITECG